ncbi:oxidoreductase-like protein [Lenzites betulinus]|nr:oxidoreductase-like protein [Lenzites betulinus]
MSVQRLSRPFAQQRNQIQYHLRCSTLRDTSARFLATAGPLHEPEAPADAPAVDPQQLSQLKRPTRGGQDLSKRHERLARSLRGKTVYGREILDLTGQHTSQQDDVLYTSTEDTREASTHVGQKTQRIFKGYVIPSPPKPPAEDECCMSGCAVCVYDLYDEARQDYMQALDKLRANLAQMGVSEDEWPSDIKRKDRSSEPPKRSDVILSAFEQFELALKQKKERERQPLSGPTDGGGSGGVDIAHSEGQYTTS